MIGSRRSLGSRAIGIGIGVVFLVFATVAPVKANHVLEIFHNPPEYVESGEALSLPIAIASSCTVTPGAGVHDCTGIGATLTYRVPCPNQPGEFCGVTQYKSLSSIPGQVTTFEVPASDVTGEEFVYVFGAREDWCVFNVIRTACHTNSTWTDLYTVEVR